MDEPGIGAYKITASGTFEVTAYTLGDSLQGASDEFKRRLDTAFGYLSQDYSVKYDLEVKEI